MKALWAIVAVLALPGAARALDCSAAATQADMNACAARDFRAADAELNAAYGRARDFMRSIDKGLPQPDRGAEKALLAAQRAWITFRDQACAAEGYAYHGGSMEPLVVTTCATRLTGLRTKDLIEMSKTN